MVKILKKEKYIFFILFIVVGIICSIFFAGEKTPDNDVISASMSANYIALILNNIYILYIYFKTKKLYSIHDKIICRIGQKKFLNRYLINSVLDIFFYILITYFIIYLKLGINLEYIFFFVIFLITNYLNFFLQELVSTIVFFTKKDGKFIVYPIIMNLAFHYYFIPFLIEIFNKSLGGI